MSCCLVMQDMNSIIIGADSATSVAYKNDYKRISNDAKKIYRFGEEVMFLSGRMEYIEYVAKNVPMSGNRIDKVKLQNLLKSLELPPIENNIISIDVLIAGVENKLSYLHDLSERDDFELKTKHAFMGVQVWSGGYKTEECVDTAIKIFSKTKNIKSTYIDTYKSIACDEIGGNLTVYQITPDGVEMFIDNYDLQDGIVPILDIINSKAFYINGEVLVGKLVLGNTLGIYNKSGSLTFRDEDGLKVSNGKNYFEVNPNSNTLLKLSKTVDGTTENLLTVDENGKLAISGKFSASNGSNTFEVDPDNNDMLLKIKNKDYGDVFYVDASGKIHLWENDVVLDTNGLNFYMDADTYIGKIGKNYIIDHEELYGLTYDLKHDTSFVTWTYETSENAGAYSTKWAYYSKDIPYKDKDGVEHILSGDTLHAGTDIDMHYHKLKNISWEDGSEYGCKGVTGTMKFKQIVSFDSNGVPVCYDAELEFKNGILIRRKWHDE